MTMMRSKTLLISILLLPFLVFLFPSKGLSQSFLKGVEGEKKGPTVVRSNSLEIDDKQKIVTFLGGVDATKDSLHITCQRLVVYYHYPKEQRGEKNPGKGEMKIEKIVATGDVKIQRPNGGIATAEQATYYQSDERVVLSGKPMVKQGEDFVEGTVITLFLKEDRSIVEGTGEQKVRAVLSPGGSGR